jgi:hypothetical protein
MARTKIVIEVESEDEHFILSTGKVVAEYARDLLNHFTRHVPTARPKFTITHDGKNVTEVIQ